ncbi:SAG-related sequence [Besnoitia besnoiti]|uniref:SAG-related sequence n=1 Tax=Besnoitia besnoiti TaxID=94643 RepID=A0A2A9MKW6_BESBE|nr:SAG-related sequence [Besnoitia besnoiti]PFH36080.1 SAG-related sequence [Besnoitia besnoiti]
MALVSRMQSARPQALFLASLIALAYCAVPSKIGVLAASTKTDCVPGEKDTTCTCDSTATGEERLSATLSQEKNVMKIVCEPQMTCAPEDLLDKVCPAEQVELKGCQLKLSDLLAEDATSVAWEAEKVKAKENGETKSLTIPTQNFPYSDQRFAVGCTGENKKCKVVVTVEARPTVTDGQTVTCAYGASSNTSHQAVTLSPSNNSFTLVCGEKGDVLPATYETTYCVSGSTDAAETCDEKWTSVFADYDSKWWKNPEGTNSFTLSIPTDKFPSEQKKVMVGCQQKKETNDEQRKAGAPAGPTVCSVDVTIEATSSASFTAATGVVSFLAVIGGLISALGHPA